MSQIVVFYAFCERIYIPVINFFTVTIFFTKMLFNCILIKFNIIETAKQNIHVEVLKRGSYRVQIGPTFNDKIILRNTTFIDKNGLNLQE